MKKFIVYLLVLFTGQCFGQNTVSTNTPASVPACLVCKDTKKCSSCNETGESRCTKCNGEGKQKDRCSRCGGDGRVSDTVRRFGKTRRTTKTCNQCSGGYRKKSCSICNGDGKVTCEKCNGKKECAKCAKPKSELEAKQDEQKTTSPQLPASINRPSVP